MWKMKVLEAYKRRIKKIMSMFGLNLADNQLAHIKNCKGLVEALKTLCNIYKIKFMSNILLVRRKLFMCKIQKEEYSLDRVNKVKTLTIQIACLER